VTPAPTDYLIIGSGAIGLAFADTLLDETDATLTIVDKHGQPGGHWNDAYSFVTLHQPSAFYGVNSMPLGSGTLDEIGPNAGLFELASGAEVSAYFDRVMNKRLLPTGRVRYLPMHEHLGGGEVVSLLTGKRERIQPVRKIVDGTFFGTSVPSTHTPKFKIGDGVRLVPPNALPNLWLKPENRAESFVVLGAGKTAMDAVVWLLRSDAEAERIQWVVPRDSWLLNRLGTQPGDQFFHQSIGGQLAQMRALATATDIDDLFLKLEAAGVMLRIDPTVMPTMFHYATVSTGEIALLQTVSNVVRKGRVTAISTDRITLERGEVSVQPNTLFIDCTASAATPRAPVPVFQAGLITPQMVRLPQPAFSAALIAYIEAHYGSDDEKNALCQPAPFIDELSGFPAATLGNMMNQFAWSQDKKLTAWIRGSRLDGFGKVISGVKPDETDKMKVLLSFREATMSAVANIRARFLAE